MVVGAALGKGLGEGLDAGTVFGGQARTGSGFGAWALSQAAPFLMRKADGRVLVWTCRGE